MSDIRYCYYPRTRAPPEFVDEDVAAFQVNEDTISTVEDDNGLKSDDVLDVVRDDLENYLKTKERAEELDAKFEKIDQHIEVDL